MPDTAKKKPAARKKAPVRKSVSRAKKKMLSIVFSFRNEAEVLDELLDRLHSVLDGLGYDLEFIFVNDASTDTSLEILHARAKKDRAIRIITMSSRFGVNPCFLAGMRAANGDAIITMDTDLQDPPETIPELLEQWEAGCDVVHTKRLAREGESWVKMTLTRGAYRLINTFSEITLPIDAGMFKLVSRRAANAITSVGEVDMYLRGIMTWVGFEQGEVLYKREERFAGRAHFPLTHKDPWLVFVRGFFSFSRVPVAALFFLGAALLGIGGIGALGLPLLAWAGWSFVFEYWALSVIVLLAGTNLVGLGIIGVYLSRVYNQVKGRPEYIIADRFGFGD